MKIHVHDRPDQVLRQRLERGAVDLAFVHKAIALLNGSASSDSQAVDFIGRDGGIRTRDPLHPIQLFRHFGEMSWDAVKLPGTLYAIVYKQFILNTSSHTVQRGFKLTRANCSQTVPISSLVD